MKNDVIIITGPTAVGKTRISILLAEFLNGEIVSADSRQVYKYMDIGTAKPTLEEQATIPHHMIDILLPDEDIDVASYSMMAREKISDIISKGRFPIIVGGTNLYIKGIVDGIFKGPGRNEKIRKDLNLKHSEKPDRLYSMLKEIDPESSQKIHPNDSQRIIRALEIYYLTGKAMSKFKRDHGFGDSYFNPLLIGLQRERDDLYDLINKRVNNMIESGFIEEVRKLQEMGYNSNLNSMQGLGYRYLNLYLQRQMKLEEAIDLTKRDTRRYAKRQMTWLNKEDRINWINLYNKGFEKVINEILNLHKHQKEEANV